MNLPSEVDGLIVDPGSDQLAEDGGVFEEMLESLPDLDVARTDAWIMDWRVWWDAAEAGGLQRPGPDAPADWLRTGMQQRDVAWRDLPRMVQTPFLCCPRDYLATFQPYPYVGFDLRSVDASLWAGEPPREFEAVLGRYDPADTAKRLSACDECVQHEKREHSGIEYYRWGDDFQANLRNRLAPPLMDHLGRGGRLVVSDGHAMRSLHDAGIEAMIDAKHGRTESLADREDYALAARAVLGLGAYAVGIRTFFSCNSDGSGPGASSGCLDYSVDHVPEEHLGLVKSEPLLAPFSVVAAGYVLDSRDGKTRTVLALVHEDAEAAQLNAQRLPARMRIDGGEAGLSLGQGMSPSGAPWGTFWGRGIGRVEISTDGRVLLARLFPADGDDGAGVAPMFVLGAPNVLAHE